jgi:Tol biopolymer transport system component
MATSTSVPTATSTPIAGAPIERCVEILPDFPEGGVPSGTLVIKMSEGLSLLNFRQQTTRLIPGSFEGVGTSPDGKWLAYASRYNNGSELIVESLNGEKKVPLFPYDRMWFIFGNPWVGNEWLSYLIWDGGLGLKTVAINPFTSEQKLLLPDYPNFIDYYNGQGGVPLYFGYSNVVYDPSLRFVVYPKETDYGLYAALWDREASREIAKVFTWGGFLPSPLWFPDSHAFVVTGLSNKESTQEWFMVGIDGKIHQLTHFGDQYTKYEFGDFASLSPDGHYLAFGLSHEGDSSLNSPELIILDLTTLNAFNTCITFGSNSIWSPDSQYLVIQHPDTNQKRPSVVVLNVDTGWAASIFPKDDEYRRPVGWLDSGE